MENIHTDGLHQPAPATVYASTGIETAANGSTTVQRAVAVAIRSSRAGSKALSKGTVAACWRGDETVASLRTLKCAVIGRDLHLLRD